MVLDAEFYSPFIHFISPLLMEYTCPLKSQYTPSELLVRWFNKHNYFHFLCAEPSEQQHYNTINFFRERLKMYIFIPLLCGVETLKIRKHQNITKKVLCLAEVEKIIIKG